MQCPLTAVSTKPGQVQKAWLECALLTQQRKREEKMSPDRESWLKRLTLPVVVALVAVGVVPGTGARAEVAYNWYAEHKNAEAIGYDITTLFLALHQRGLLSLEQYEDTVGKSVVEIMREQNRFVGPSFPPTLDRLLCELNSHVCKVVAEPKAGAPTFVWSGKPRTTYTLPGITFERYQTPQRYEKGKTERVQDVVVKKLMGCVAFNPVCRETIAHLNPGIKNPFDPSYAGPITLPSLGVKAAVPGLETLRREVSAPTPAQQAAGQGSPPSLTQYGWVLGTRGPTPS